MTTKLVRQSVVQAGPIVTTIGRRYDAVGIGYIYEGEIYKTLGNGYAVPAANSWFGLDGIFQDGGDFYVETTRGMELTDEIRKQARETLEKLRL